MGLNAAVGKVLYGVIFVVVIPAILVWWATATESIVALPIVSNAWIGTIVVALGVALMVAGAWALRIHGRGLPMSPYPPPEYVTKGIFRLVSHPIYVGFVILCLGVSVVVGSPSGLWLVTPAVALACMALVLGHEHHELRRRFGAASVCRPLISLPVPSAEHPGGWDRLSVFLLVLLPWSLAFEAVYRLGLPPDAIEAYLSFERSWPVLEWTEVIYGSVCTCW